jgi:xeroderma pigmentosum group C-complementing protein
MSISFGALINGIGWAKPKKGRQLSIDLDVGHDDQMEEVGAGLYAKFQTRLYVPPPVVNGRVPRNIYGNLDLYVPSMCPPGGSHVRHKLASKAARIVGVDYAEAVTGFSFKGRHGTAVVQGVVVAREYAEAVQEVIDGMIYAQEQAANDARTRESLRLWRRFFLGLRIAQRVNAMEIDGEKGPAMDVQTEIEREDKQEGSFRMKQTLRSQQEGNRNNKSTVEGAPCHMMGAKMMREAEAVLYPTKMARTKSSKEADSC